ncbi:MAG TPA: hypothetical protein VGW38_13625, partial [Chloroflexota bacterium]|nr:hypothetical protein [Chloroflexota bacterium]
DGVTAYLQARHNVEVGLIPEHVSVERHLLQERGRAYQLASRGAPAYYVLTDAPNGEQERRFKALNPAAELVLERSKPGNHSRFQLYRLQWLQPTSDVWLEMPVRFGEHIQLTGYALDSRVVQPGEILRLTLYWETDARVKTDYTVFNHLVDATGARVGQRDGQPRLGRAPTSRWRPQELIADTHEITIPGDAPTGIYELIVGLYDLRTMQRLPVTSGSGGNHAELRRISVTIR